MANRCLCVWVLVMAIAWPAAGRAQVPGLPGGAAAPGAAVPAGAAGALPTAAPTRNLWSFLCPSADQKAACRAKFCNSSVGQLVNNTLKPATAFSGGLVPDLCPPKVDPTDLNRAAEDPQGVAARIQKLEAESKARRAAVRYLGTVDCHYFPEAETGLLTALRTDTNECVRLEAALALGRGCCCSKKVIDTLTVVVECSDRDKSPAETSARVRAAANAALQRCLSCYVQRAPSTPAEPPEPAAPEGPAAVALRPFPRPPLEPSLAPTVDGARVASSRYDPAPRMAVAATEPPRRHPVPTGQHDLLSLMRGSVAPAAPEAAPAPVIPTPPAGPVLAENRAFLNAPPAAWRP
jgi:hypothetical protein